MKELYYYCTTTLDISVYNLGYILARTSRWENRFQAIIKDKVTCTEIVDNIYRVLANWLDLRDNKVPNSFRAPAS